MNGPSRFIGSVQASADPTEDMELATKHYVDGELNSAELTDTTYTFANGTAGNFTVTPEGGTTQTVSVGKPATAGTADKATAANLTTTQNAIAKYSDTTGTFTNSGVTIDSNNNITTAGKLTVGADPVDDMDVITKQYFDNRYKTGTLYKITNGRYKITDKDDNNIISLNSLKIGDKFITHSSALLDSGAVLEDTEGNTHYIGFSPVQSGYASYIHIFTYIELGIEMFVVDSYGLANASPTI